MKVQVKLFVELERYQPPGARDGSAEVELPAGATVGDLLASLRIPPSGEHIVLLNGRHCRPEVPLEEGQVVSIFPPVAGG
ncbi:MAG: MoaD/ThiS family protein [Nitrospinota bacterium]